MADQMVHRESADAALITAVLLDSALCFDCIVQKTGVPAPRAHEVLATISRAVKVDSAGSLCSSCMITKQVFQINVG